MSERRVELALYGLATLLVAVAASRCVAALAEPAADGDTPTAAPAPRPSAPESLAAWAEVATRRDPFRLDRRPAAVRFGAQAAPPPNRPERPVLVLLGTMGGPPWQAAIGGVPGRTSAAVVSSGQSVAGLRVAGVWRDSARIEGADTAWTLHLRRARP